MVSLKFFSSTLFLQSFSKTKKHNEYSQKRIFEAMHNRNQNYKKKTIRKNIDNGIFIYLIILLKTTPFLTTPFLEKQNIF